MIDLPPLREDPYALAYRYWDYMVKPPRRFRENCNPYYEKLLANQPEPAPDATDDRSRIIRHAKQHYECFYEIKDISRIIGWLPTGVSGDERAVHERQNNRASTTILATPQRPKKTILRPQMAGSVCFSLLTPATAAVVQSETGYIPQPTTESGSE
ncbi:hypothetical protein EJ02DRAFT_429764 [Clathrospora elynae]|uniref:Uncharacterized protein n=1 Tax=Clathrospora elynae TaxID=706981 RepID=A0A6A5T7C3_9PLEO|nr:hypothetical protein EJ02DRAFT_429764 [Clathrospora elynae]